MCRKKVPGGCAMLTYQRHIYAMKGSLLKVKCFLLVILITIKREVATHEAIKRVLHLPMRHSNIDILYIPAGLKKNRTRMLKSLSTLEKMRRDDTNVFAPNIIDKYENRPDNL